MVCWALVVVLLGGVSSSSSSSPSSSSGTTDSDCTTNCTTNTNQLQVVCAAAGDSVTVPCPEMSGDTVTFQLRAGGAHVDTYHLGSNETARRGHRGARVAVRLAEGRGGGGGGGAAVAYVLSGVSAQSAGLYGCEAKVWEPTPVRKTCGPRVFVHMMEEHRCSCQAEQRVNGSQSCEPAAVPDWMWVMGTAVLGTYGLTATIIAMVIWGRLRRLDSNHSDYMNTKPRHPPRKSRHKNTRVQTPSRHFC